MSADLLVWTGSFAAVAAIALLRVSWGRPVRSAARNGAAWALLLLGVVLGALAYGAWGVAMASLAATAAAFVLLVHAALRDRSKAGRASERRANVLPERAPLAFGRRLASFALNVPLALAAALLLGVGARGLAGLAGWGEADGTVLAWFLVPLGWTALLVALPLAHSRRSQGLMLAAPVLLGGVGLLAGGAA